MNLKNVALEVAKLGDHPLRKGITKPTGWYQIFDLPGITTVDHSPTSVRTFRKLLTLFDYPVCGKKLLDIGCNAGLHCIEAAILGLSCVGIDNKDIWLDQAKFVKKFYELMLGRSLDIVYEKVDAMTYDLTKLGYFDYCLILGVATELPLSKGHPRFSRRSMEAQSNLLGIIQNVSKNVIISTNDNVEYMNADYYNSLMLDRFTTKGDVTFLGRRYIRYEAT